MVIVASGKVPELKGISNTIPDWSHQQRVGRANSFQVRPLDWVFSGLENLSRIRMVRQSRTNFSVEQLVCAQYFSLHGMIAARASSVFCLQLVQLLVKQVDMLMQWVVPCFRRRVGKFFDDKWVMTLPKTKQRTQWVSVGVKVHHWNKECIWEPGSLGRNCESWCPLMPSLMSEENDFSRS